MSVITIQSTSVNTTTATHKYNLLKNPRGNKNLYAFWADHIGNHVYYKYSTNNGATWTTPVDDEFGNACYQSNPYLLSSQCNQFGYDDGTGFRIVQCYSDGTGNGNDCRIVTAVVTDASEDLGSQSDDVLDDTGSTKIVFGQGQSACINGYWIILYGKKDTTPDAITFYVRLCTIQNPTSAQLVDEANWTTRNGHSLGAYDLDYINEDFQRTRLIPIRKNGDDHEFVAVWYNPPDVAGGSDTYIYTTRITVDPTQTGDAKLSAETTRTVAGSGDGDINGNFGVIRDPTDSDVVWISYWKIGTSFSSVVTKFDFNGGGTPTITDYTVYSDTNASVIHGDGGMIYFEQPRNRMFYLGVEYDSGNTHFDLYTYSWNGSGFTKIIKIEDDVGDVGIMRYDGRRKLDSKLLMNHGSAMWNRDTTSDQDDLVFMDMKFGSRQKVSYGTKQSRVVGGTAEKKYVVSNVA